MSTVAGPDEVAEAGKGQVMSHSLKGVYLYVKSNRNPQRLHGEQLSIFHLRMLTMMTDTDVEGFKYGSREIY